MQSTSLVLFVVNWLINRYNDDMMSDVDIQVKVTCNEIELQALDWINKALRLAIHMEKLPSVDLSVVIVDNVTIQQLNHTYRDVNRPTDVLSFPMWEKRSEIDASVLLPIPLGDIVISLEKAKEQAVEYGHSLEREVAFLSVHGFLHLIGFRHNTKEEERRMFQKQEQILLEIGLTR